MDTTFFVDELLSHNIDYFTGVPDSLLSPLCALLNKRWQNDPKRHVIAHNEGGCLALAAGYHLATGKIPCVYLQNSGLGNIVNPVASLTSEEMYAIPTLFIVGWRGQPGTKDEPQHKVQGEITQEVLGTLGIETVILSKEVTKQELSETLNRFSALFKEGKSAAFLVEKGAFKNDDDSGYKNSYSLEREKAISIITEYSENDIIISTTGKISRELYQIRENEEFGHQNDFLTVGSMGHSSMIALGVALQKPKTNVICLDGDGAFLMHMGAAGVIASVAPKNYLHIVLNNMAHESVGGMPTCLDKELMNLPQTVLSLGYKNAFTVQNEEELKTALKQAFSLEGPNFIEVKVKLFSRDDLIRPHTTPIENKIDFMNFLREAE